MSAFVVSKDHIDALVAVAVYGPKGAASRWEGPRWAQHDPRETHWRDQVWREAEATSGSRVEVLSPDALGDLLATENVRSVMSRYPDTLDGGSVPGPCDEYWREPFRFRAPRPQPTIVQALKIIDCYEYQSCEHEQWIDSEAHRFCECLRGCLIGCLPGYSEAPWEWETPKPKPGPQLSF